MHNLVSKGARHHVVVTDPKTGLSHTEEAELPENAARRLAAARSACRAAIRGDVAFHDDEFTPKPEQPPPLRILSTHVANLDPGVGGRVMGSGALANGVAIHEQWEKALQREKDWLQQRSLLDETGGRALWDIAAEQKRLREEVCGIPKIYGQNESRIHREGQNVPVKEADLSGIERRLHAQQARAIEALREEKKTLRHAEAYGMSSERAQSRAIEAWWSAQPESEFAQKLEAARAEAMVTGAAGAMGDKYVSWADMLKEPKQLPGQFWYGSQHIFNEDSSSSDFYDSMVERNKYDYR